MLMRFKTNLRLKSNIIDPVPFINVMLLYILFFILAVQFIGKPGVVVTLPKTEQSELFKEDSVVVTLVDEKIFLFENPIGIDRLKEELTKRNPQLVAIRANKDIPHSRVTEIISLAQQVGIKQIAIATESGEKQ